LGDLSLSGKAASSDDDGNAETPEAFVLQYGAVTNYADSTTNTQVVASISNSPVSFVTLTVPPTPLPIEVIKSGNGASLSTSSSGNTRSGDETVPTTEKTHNAAIITFGIAALVAVFVAGSLGSILILRALANDRDKKKRISRRRDDEFAIHHGEQHNISGDETYNFDHIHDDDPKREHDDMTYPDTQQSAVSDPSYNLGAVQNNSETGHNLLDTFDLSRTSSSQRLGFM
jgi:hypothetical protein